MLEKRQAPPNLHFQSLNPHIDMEEQRGEEGIQTYTDQDFIQVSYDLSHHWSVSWS